MMKICDQNEQEIFNIELHEYNKKRVNQGDIIKNVEHVESIKEEEGILSVSLINFPYVYVLTQDCDLNNDYKNRTIPTYKSKDKLLISVLVAPLYNASQVCEGSHLSELKRPMQKIDKYNKKHDFTTRYSFLTHNEIPRYYYLEFPRRFEIVDSIIDFKHYFSVNIEYLEEKKK